MKKKGSHLLLIIWTRTINKKKKKVWFKITAVSKELKEMSVVTLEKGSRS